MHPDFQTNGLLHIPKAIGVDAVVDVREKLWREISQRFGIVETDPATWFANDNKPAGDHRGRRLAGMTPVLNRLAQADAFSSVEGSLASVVDDALGPARWTAKPAWYSLLSFPGEGSVWNVPHASWHADEPAAAEHALPWTVFAFVFLAPVLPRGGGTVVVTGSHRCAERVAKKVGGADPVLVNAFADDNRGLVDPETLRVISPTEIAQRLADEDPWFNALVTKGTPEERIPRFISEGGDIDGIGVKVVEVTGVPGDVVLLDPRCLHSVSVNAQGLPRQILRLDFRRAP